MPQDTDHHKPLKTEQQRKADKRAAALRGNLQKRKAFIKENIKENAKQQDETNE